MKNTTNLRNLLYAAALLLFTGCGKLQGTVTPTLSTPDHSSSAVSYLPVTKGSYWEYQVSANGVTDTAITTMTGQMGIYDSKTYYEASTSYKAHKFLDNFSYYSSANHAYNVMQINRPDTLEQYFFNDTTSLYGVWITKVNQSGYIGGKPARIDGQLIEQNISFKVQGTTYTGVNHTKIYLQYSLGDNNYSTADTYDFFVVKGIGIIALYTTDNTTGATTAKELIAYAVK